MLVLCKQKKLPKIYGKYTFENTEQCIENYETNLQISMYEGKVIILIKNYKQYTIYDRSGDLW